MKIERKYLVAGAIGVVTIAGALAYLQYKRLMNYIIKLKGIKLNRVDFSGVDLNLFLNFENKSDVNFTIESQRYDVYLNDIFVAKAENKSPNNITKKSTSVIGVNVKFNPSSVLSKLGKSVADFLTSPDKIKLRVDIKLKVKVWLFKVSIPYVYESTLKDLITSK